MKFAAPVISTIVCLSALTSNPVVAQSDWSKLTVATSPSARFWTPAVTERARILLFGGGTRANYTLNNDTWAWRLNTWSKLSPTTSPSGRTGHELAFDAQRGKTVLFGGYDGNLHFGDTWEFDGTNWTRIQPANSPSARSGHAMAYDPVRRVIVLFGGQSLAGPQNDTWTFDGTNWKQITTSTAPSARCYHGMAWDGNSERILMIGGYLGSGLSDVWVFDGASWARMPSGPSARFGSGATWDAARRRVVVHGGWGGTDTWDWDGSKWSIRPTVTTPTNTGYSTTAYDPLSRQVLRFFGQGTGTNNYPNEVWALKTTAPSSAQSYGTSCKGSTSTASLRAGTALSWIGESAPFELSMARASSPAIFSLGLSDKTWGAAPLPFDLKVFGASSCFLYQSLDALVVTTTDSSGKASIALPIPNDSALSGATYFVQFLLPDAGANSFGLTTTGGVRSTIGIL